MKGLGKAGQGKWQWGATMKVGVGKGVRVCEK